MGKFTFDFPSDLERQILALERAGSAEVVGRMLEVGGKKVEEGFSYSSGNNAEWLSVEDIRELLKSVDLGD